VKHEYPDWSLYPPARDDEWTGYTFPTLRPDWSQYCGTNTNYQESLPWVSPVLHDPILPVVNYDEELEYAMLLLTEEQELQHTL
jgi:hypothetical protein